jgi:hypothetical protein
MWGTGECHELLELLMMFMNNLYMALAIAISVRSKAHKVYRCRKIPKKESINIFKAFIGAYINIILKHNLCA